MCFCRDINVETRQHRELSSQEEASSGGCWLVSGCRIPHLSSQLSSFSAFQLVKPSYLFGGPKVLVFALGDAAILVTCDNPCVITALGKVAPKMKERSSSTTVHGARCSAYDVHAVTSVDYQPRRLASDISFHHTCSFSVACRALLSLPLSAQEHCCPPPCHMPDVTAGYR